MTGLGVPSGLSRLAGERFWAGEQEEGEAPTGKGRRPDHPPRMEPSASFPLLQVLLTQVKATLSQRHTLSTGLTYWGGAPCSLLEKQRPA